jgi:hypothetical protein
MTGSVDFALNDDAVGVMAMVTVDEQSQKGSDEEEDNVPGSKLVLCFSRILLSMLT